jgi:hypothetical protein
LLIEAWPLVSAPKQSGASVELRNRRMAHMVAPSGFGALASRPPRQRLASLMRRWREFSTEPHSASLSALARAGTDGFGDVELGGRSCSSPTCPQPLVPAFRVGRYGAQFQPSAAFKISSGVSRTVRVSVAPPTKATIVPRCRTSSRNSVITLSIFTWMVCPCSSVHLIQVPTVVSLCWLHPLCVVAQGLCNAPPRARTGRLLPRAVGLPQRHHPLADRLAAIMRRAGRERLRRCSSGTVSRAIVS